MSKPAVAGTVFDTSHQEGEFLIRSSALAALARYRANMLVKPI